MGDASAGSQSYRETVYFTGRVQGVGFRYATLQVAREYEVSGYVRNLPDGRVELEAEGDEAEVRRFVGSVMDQMSDYIRKTERSGGSRSLMHQGFTIR